MEFKEVVRQKRIMECKIYDLLMEYQERTGANPVDVDLLISKSVGDMEYNIQSVTIRIEI